MFDNFYLILRNQSKNYKFINIRTDTKYIIVTCKIYIVHDYYLKRFGLKTQKM